MNYEALGRYTEAKERAGKLAGEVNLKMTKLSRLCRPVDGKRVAEAREYDFAAMGAELRDAQAAYEEMLSAISAANHEAPACEREALKLSKY